MSNMSYCRFQNTEKDLRDCKFELDQEEIPESKEEQKARYRLIQMCVKIADEFGDDNPTCLMS